MIKNFIACLLVSGLLAGCGGDSASTADSTQQLAATTMVKGKILDKQDQPISAALIAVGDTTVPSGVDGSYEIAVSQNVKSVVLLVKKAGYGTNAKEVLVSGDRISVQDINLFADDIQSTIAASAGGTIFAANNASVKIEPNSIQTIDGKAYTDNVTVSVNYHGPDTLEGIQAFPQPYSGIDNSQQAVLRSVGVIEVKLSDSTGKPLQLNSAVPATLTYPATSVAEGATNIPLWYYDEAQRTWIREGQVTLQADGTYQGTVKHFTLWNVDKPYLVAENTRLKGCLKDASGNPVKGGVASIRGSGFATAGNTDNLGTFESYVPSGTKLEVSYYFNIASRVLVDVPALSAGEVRQLACQTTTVTVDPKATLVMPRPVIWPTPTPVQNYAGVYSGSYTGVEAGTFAFTITSNGAVSGQGFSNTYLFNFNVAGNIVAGGAVSINATGSAGASDFKGMVDAVTGQVNGTWNYSGVTSGGTFKGQKQ
ncbi:MAG: astroprincin family protein [Burkholderiaceae bacterium]